MSPVNFPRPGFRVIFFVLFLVSVFILLHWSLSFEYVTGVPKMKQFCREITDFQRDWFRERKHRVDWRGFIKPCEGQMGWGQTKPGWGRENRSNATASTISFWDIRPAGEFSKFLIQSRTADGRAKIIGGDSWRVYLRGPSSRAATIFDHNNGSYEALFLIMEPGVYRVLIYLDYSLCAGLKDPPRDWFIQGNAQGSNQKDELLGILDDYLFQDFVHDGEHLNITVPATRLNSTIEEKLQGLSLPCESKCRFLWDGFGRWVNNKWEPFLKQSFQWNASKLVQPNGTCWTYGDSLALRFSASIRSRPLCRRLYKRCPHSYNWVYPVGNKGSAKKKDDYLDFDRSRVINYIRVVLDKPFMQTAESMIFLNLGLHFATRINFTSYQAVMYDIVEMLRETEIRSNGRQLPRYKANVVWKTNTAISKEKGLILQGTPGRFLTAPRVHLFSMYATSAMCNAGHQVLDVYPLTDSFPGGTLGRGDLVHYRNDVFRSVQELLEKHKADPEGLEADMNKTKAATCTSWET